jgi:hypothetical protein
VLVNNSGVIQSPANFATANGLQVGNSSNATVWTTNGATAFPLGTNNAADFTSVEPLLLTAYTQAGITHFSNSFDLGASMTLSNATASNATVAASLSSAGLTSTSNSLGIATKQNTNATLDTLLRGDSTPFTNLPSGVLSNAGSGVVIAIGNAGGTNLIATLKSANTSKLAISLFGGMDLFTLSSGFWYDAEAGHSITQPTILNGGSFALNGSPLYFGNASDGQLITLQLPFSQGTLIFSNVTGVTSANFVGFNSVNLNGTPFLNASNFPNRYRLADYLSTAPGSGTANYLALLNLFSLALTNGVLEGSPLYYDVAIPTNQMHGFSLPCSNLKFIGNGVVLGNTNLQLTAGQSIVDLNNATGLYVENATFNALEIPTNGAVTAQSQCWFTLNGTNNVLEFARCHFDGGRDVWVTGTETLCANYDVYIHDSFFTNIGNIPAADGAPWNAAAMRMRWDRNYVNYCYRGFEFYNASQWDVGEFSAEHNVVLNRHAEAFATPSGWSGNSIILKDWFLDNPAQSNNITYASGYGIVIANAISATVEDITINGTNFGSGFQANVYSNLTVRGFHGLATESGDVITAGNYDVRASQFGGLTFNAGATGSLYCVQSASRVNNGVIQYEQDCSGNVTAATVVTGFVRDNGTSTWGGIMQHSGVIISNSATIASFGSLSLYPDLIHITNTTTDTSIYYYIGKSFVNFPTNAPVTVVNESTNRVFLNAGQGTGSWLGFNSAIVTMKPNDSITYIETPNLLKVVGGNIWPNMNAGVLNFSGGAFMFYVATNHFLRGYGSTTNSIYDNGTLQVETPGLN